MLFVLIGGSTWLVYLLIKASLLSYAILWLEELVWINIDIGVRSDD